METTIRAAGATAAAECGRIIYAAFTALADRHGFSRPFPSPEVATGLATMRLTNPGRACDRGRQALWPNELFSRRGATCPARRVARRQDHVGRARDPRGNRRRIHLQPLRLCGDDGDAA